jgi:hypothetical protein
MLTAEYVCVGNSDVLPEDASVHESLWPRPQLVTSTEAFPTVVHCERRQVVSELGLICKDTISRLMKAISCMRLQNVHYRVK